MSIKYHSLARFLQEKDQDMIRMTFDEVEDIIRGKLPPSAREHRAWWSNSTTHSHARHGWLDAGWETAQVDMDGQDLVFIRMPVPLKEPKNLRSSSRSFHLQSISPSSPSLDTQLAEILRVSGGVENLRDIVSAIQNYIEGELLETELGQILRKRWPR